MTGNKIELMSMLGAAFLSTFVMEMMEKVIITTVAMVIGTTIAYYWKKYLKSNEGNK
jgi:ABC-type transport system involved in cytochrome bd biosynthesis fused ATPase/permease subunit